MALFGTMISRAMLRPGPSQRIISCWVTTAASVNSGPDSAQAPSNSGITRSASTSPRPAKRGIAASPISVTTSVVVSGMKVMIAKARRNTTPLRAA